jgi:hypothetical protein
MRSPRAFSNSPEGWFHISQKRSEDSVFQRSGYRFASRNRVKPKRAKLRSNPE